MIEKSKFVKNTVETGPRVRSNDVAHLSDEELNRSLKIDKGYKRIKWDIPTLKNDYEKPKQPVTLEQAWSIVFFSFMYSRGAPRLQVAILEYMRRKYEFPKDFENAEVPPELLKKVMSVRLNSESHRKAAPINAAADDQEKNRLTLENTQKDSSREVRKYNFLTTGVPEKYDQYLQSSQAETGLSQFAPPSVLRKTANHRVLNALQVNINDLRKDIALGILAVDYYYVFLREDSKRSFEFSSLKWLEGGTRLPDVRGLEPYSHLFEELRPFFEDAKQHDLPLTRSDANASFYIKETIFNTDNMPKIDFVSNVEMSVSSKQAYEALVSERARLEASKQ